MSFKDAVAALREHIWEPEDYTYAAWKREYGGVTWFEGDWDDECNDESYFSERLRNVHESNGYMIGTLDDGCGGRYQAIFDLSKEVTE